MNESPQTAEARMADAIRDLSEQTRTLVRSEISAAQQEMWDKARQSLPALGLLAVAGSLGTFAAAAGYRWVLRLLEKRVPPASAAMVASVGYGAGAAVAAAMAARQLRRQPAPVPTQTARHATDRLAETAAHARG